MNRLEGRRILVIEDEALVAEMVSDILVQLGATVVGPAGSLALGLSLAEAAALDGAVLDVNLHGELIGPLAQRLAARGIPFLFATGYGSAPIEGWEDVPIIDKPYNLESFSQALLTTFGAQAGGATGSREETSSA